MGQIIKSLAPPTVNSFPLDLLAGSPQLGGLTSVQTIEVDNGSNLTLSVFGDGQLIRTLTPYVSRWNINTAGGWQDITITANTAAIQATDQVTIIAYDTVVPVLFPPSFGVSAWGAGAVPNQLVSITPGNSLLAWQVQQLINLLTGVMTGQQVTLDREDGTYELVLQRVAATAATWGFAVNTNGELDIDQPINVTRIMTLKPGGGINVGPVDSIIPGVGEVVAQGAGAAMTFSDRDLAGADYFSWYVASGIARLFSSVLNADALTVSETGILQVNSNEILLTNSALATTFVRIQNNFPVALDVGIDSSANVFITTNNGTKKFNINNHFYPSNDNGGQQSVSALHAGNGVPNNANGSNGDFYFRGDGAAGTFIYHKAAGAWTAFA